MPGSRMTLVAAVLLAVAWPSLAVAQDRVAVLEFTSNGSVGESELTFLADRVRGAALQSLDPDEWKVMTRENMAVLLEASAEDLAACEGECEVETGRLIGASRIVAGSAMVFGTRYVVMLRMYDTASAELIGTQEASAGDLDGLWDEVPLACGVLFGGAGVVAEVAQPVTPVVEAPAPRRALTPTDLALANPLLSAMIRPAPQVPLTTVKYIDMQGLDKYALDGQLVSWEVTRGVLLANYAASGRAKGIQVLHIVTVGAFIWGGTYTGAAIAVTASTNDGWNRTLSPALIGMAVAGLTTAIILASTEKKRRKKAVDVYNQSMVGFSDP